MGARHRLSRRCGLWIGSNMGGLAKLEGLSAGKSDLRSFTFAPASTGREEAVTQTKSFPHERHSPQ